MESASSPTLHPEMLPPGTQVGPWRVVEWAGRGVHGAVYRAVRAGQEYSPPVALKLALLPKDPRFAREVELLSRSHHPHIPHLVDHGEWQHPSGTLHPYVVMEWVDGVPLYDWARLYHPNSQQMLRLLPTALRQHGCSPCSTARPPPRITPPGLLMTSMPWASPPAGS